MTKPQNLFKSEYWADECTFSLIAAEDPDTKGWLLGIETIGPNSVYKTTPLHGSVTYSANTFDTYLEAFAEGFRISKILGYDLDQKYAILNYNTETDDYEDPHFIEIENPEEFLK